MIIKTIVREFEADTLTPVGIYLSIRDLFPGALLLESSEHGSSIGSRSIICADVLAEFSMNGSTATTRIFDSASTRKVKPTEVPAPFSEFIDGVRSQDTASVNGVFGFTGYSGVTYFESVSLKKPAGELQSIPDLHYGFFRYIVVIDHFYETLKVIVNYREHEDPYNILHSFETLLHRNSNVRLPFSSDVFPSETTDEHFLSSVQKGIEHCKRGDVFQVVLSRRFSCGFTGDDFNAYRALRTVNPSPYLFYFDFGFFRLFGSSPESQITIENGIASVHPIAGTVKRPDNLKELEEKLEELRKDPKENSEHVMLVDLARNDLSKGCEKVEVKSFREMQMFSHVVHMVSKVTGVVKRNKSAIDLLKETFPAGTLSGAPKFRAMEIIDTLEVSSRKFYGGAVGYFGFNGDCNHAIIIRSILSTEGKLFMQAGAGVVVNSSPESELNEIENKLGALKKALFKANKSKQKHEAATA